MNMNMSNHTYTTLAEIVELFPEREGREAVRFFNGFRIFHYTYDELYDLSQRMRRFLRDRGLQKGDRLLLWAANRPEWAVVYFACVQEGVVLVPLDARNRSDFVQRVADETQAKWLIRSQTQKDPGFSFPSLLIETLFSQLNDVEPVNEPSMVLSEDWVEIVYTSGTTGKPKGVVLSQYNIASNVTDVLKVVPVDSTYHLLSVLPLSHALEQTAGFWAPFAGGGTVCYLQALKPSALFNVFQRKKITVMVLVPRLLTLLKQRIENEIRQKHLTYYLRLGRYLARFVSKSFLKWYFYPIHKRINKDFILFVSGGAALDREVEKFWNHLGYELLQGYGLTETSPVLTATRIGKTRLGSVGFPLEQVELQLGEGNEIRAKGPNVFDGYFNNPDATAEVFENGWYKTGDVGEFDEDRFLYIRSRKKDVIVTADGINIYPEDIENTLLEHPALDEVCVLGVGEQEDLIHAVLLLNDETVDPQSIIDYANGQLSPEQRIHSYSIWPLPEFPKTTTLKIKKNEVRKQIENDSIDTFGQPVVSLSAFQRIICDIGNLKPEDLKPDARLGPDLGLGSIDRIDLVSRLEEEFRLDIDDALVTVDARLSDLEQFVENRGKAESDLNFRRWTRAPFWQCVRFISNAVIVKPFLWLFCELKLTGMENLNDFKGPLLIVSNHTSHLDTLLIQNFFPSHLKRRICPAAWKEYFDAEGRPVLVKLGKWLAWQFATTLINLFPLPQSAGFRQSMAYAGELLDDGWNVLLFPEGARTTSGEMLPFREGVGIMAQNLQVPVVPVAISGGEKVLVRGKFHPKRGTVKMAVGKPFYPKDDDYRLITQKVKKEIETLLDRLKTN